MFWVGLSGGIATGKSTVSQILRNLGYEVVDADLLAREAARRGTDGYEEIVQAFGPDSVLENGEINRKRIGEIVFGDPSKLRLLESILHPRIRALAVRRRGELKQSGHKLGFYDVPLLFEKKMEALFDRIVVVACRPDTQLKRLMAREGFTEAEALRRISVQMPIGEKVKRADFVLYNESTIADLEVGVRNLVEELLNLPKLGPT